MRERRSREPLDLGAVDRAKELRRLFRAAATDDEARERIVHMHRPLAESLARRYQGYGEQLDDLIQVASIGLLNAIKRFDPERGVTFAAFATPTIVGELKRHFRDRGWAVRMPRQLQENTLKLRRVMNEISQTLGRSPTVRELATATGMSDEEVIEAGDALLAYSTMSLDSPVGEDVTLAETLTSTTDDIEVAEDWADLSPHLERLPAREQRIIALRFFRGLTQTEIAEEIGVSQMHVSRLLAGALEVLRASLGGRVQPDV
jgi:RNA polymerase sigma-B factor